MVRIVRPILRVNRVGHLLRIAEARVHCAKRIEASTHIVYHIAVKPLLHGAETEVLNADVELLSLAVGIERRAFPAFDKRNSKVSAKRHAIGSLVIELHIEAAILLHALRQRVGDTVFTKRQPLGQAHILVEWHATKWIRID